VEPNTTLNLNISRNKFFRGNNPLEKIIPVKNYLSLVKKKKSLFSVRVPYSFVIVEGNVGLFQYLHRHFLVPFCGRFPVSSLEIFFFCFSIFASVAVLRLPALHFLLRFIGVCSE
jgi:hypothetical protein